MPDHPIRRATRRSCAGTPIGRRGVVLALASVTAGLIGPAHAQPPGTRYFRIAAGPIQSRSFQVGTAIAETVSAPPGLRACGRDRVCGVAGLIGVATTTNGPLDNARLISGRQVEAGLIPASLFPRVQSDTKTVDPPNGGSPLCVLAPLYDEFVHLVVMADSLVTRITDLRGRRVCVGDDSSGGPYLPQQILSAAGLQSRHVKTLQLDLTQAAESLANREIDAFFCIEGLPSPTIQELASRADIRLIPLGAEYGPGKGVPLSTDAVIADGIYRGVDRTPTLGTLAIWAGHADLDSELVYATTRAVWHTDNRLLRDMTTSIGSSDAIRRAVSLGLPFHPGAMRFYRDLGMPS